MRVRVAIFLGLLAGCGPPHPAELTPNIPRAALVVVMAGLEAPSPTPAPNPPKPDLVECQNCGGDGIIGDGRTEMECPPCKGTGLVDPDSPYAHIEKSVVVPPKPEPVSPVVSQSTALQRFYARQQQPAVRSRYRIECRNGRCYMIPVN